MGEQTHSSYYTFFDSGVPVGAKINKAYLQLYVTEVYVTNICVSCVMACAQANVVDNPGTPTIANDRLRTEARVNWDIPNPQELYHDTITSPEIACLIQEQIDNAGAEWNGNIQIFCDGVACMTEQDKGMWANLSGTSMMWFLGQSTPNVENAPKLYIWWSADDTRDTYGGVLANGEAEVTPQWDTMSGGVLAAGEADVDTDVVCDTSGTNSWFGTTLGIQVSHCGYGLNDTSLVKDATAKFGTDTDQYHHTYFIFPNVTIPKNSTINYATVSGKQAGEVNPVPARNWGNATGNPVTPITLSDLNALSKTSNVNENGWDLMTYYVPGSPPTWAYYLQADFTCVLQEIVNRSDWVSGNTVLLATTAVDGYGEVGGPSSTYPTYLDVWYSDSSSAVGGVVLDQTDPLYEVVRPNSNVNTVWTRYDWSNIHHDNILQPAYQLTTYVQATIDDDNEEQIWGMENIPHAGDEKYKVTSVTVWLYGARNINATMKCRIKINGTWTAQQDIPFTTSNSWQSITFNDLDLLTDTRCNTYELQLAVDSGAIS